MRPDKNLQYFKPALNVAKLKYDFFNSEESLLNAKSNRASDILEEEVRRKDEKMRWGNFSFLIKTHLFAIFHHLLTKKAN